MSLIEYFLKSLDQHDTSIREIAKYVREVSVESRRVLLLLDGWDEVPLTHRAEVQRHITAELNHFVVVITSRVSGQPRQLIPNDTGDFYEIAGLSDETIRRFVRKQLQLSGKKTEENGIVARLSAEPDLREMAANPFLLGLLIGVLSSPQLTQRRFTRANLYQQVISWMTESVVGLTGEHVRALERLSFQMLCNEDAARYVFRRTELERFAGSNEAKPILQSRFVNRLDPVYDNWSWLHATLPEYLSANHLETLRDLDFSFEWTRAFYSPTRFCVLEFLAGLEGNALHMLKKQCAGWLQSPDRFGIVLQRLVRLILAGDWQQSYHPFVQELVDQLWSRVLKNEHYGFLPFFVECIAALDTDELLSRVSALRGNHGQLWEAVCNSIPANRIRGSALERILPPHLLSAVQIRDEDSVPELEIALLVRQLTDPLLPIAKLKSVFEMAATTRSREVAAAMTRRLCTLPDGQIRDEGILTLSGMSTLLSCELLVDLLTTRAQIPALLLRVASDTLSHDIDHGASLDPEGRDRILAEIAKSESRDTRFEPLLSSLIGYPIRDGAAMVAAIATNRHLDPSLRETALRVLQTASD
ncbi:MAG: hypothetical protein KDA96_26545, partial [Planctomycetaceae bacterium]|nr:hypothetical protein [Planctomycetaceae bacterium]